MSMLGRSILLSMCIGCTHAAFAETESERLNAFFEDVYQAAIKRWPQWQTNLGLKSDYDKWNDYSERKRIAEHEIGIRNLTRLRTEFDYAALDAQAQISYRLFERGALLGIEWFPFRYHYYPITHLGGVHKSIPSFLISKHAVDTRSDAQAYAARLRGVPQLVRQVIADLETRVAKGVIPPRFVFPKIHSDIAEVLTGKPFDDSDEDTAILADFKRKVAKLDLPDEERDGLVAAARSALVEAVGPAYAELAAYVRTMEAKASAEAGAWKLPDGEAYYALALRSTTTTNLAPAEIHALGLQQVQRIHTEMRALIAEIEFDGTLQDFFRFTLEDDSNYYPDTDAGRQAYLEQAKSLISQMQARLPDAFRVQPKASLEVRRVEAFREKNVDIAFYDAPGFYNDRPGVYYLNLHDMRLMPKTHLAALTYHEAVPGHHMQIALARELRDLPKFRMFGGNTAYIEGWALYAERLAKEMGGYTDPMSDFGRLAWELLRAARLVVDTGLHHEKWTRKQAIAYLDENIPQRHAANRKAIDRYIVWPSQATAYLIGMQKILQLREQAERRLGERFDLRDFHDVILVNGALPLDVLESLVEDWLED